MVRLECDLASQNCASLFHRNTKIIKTQYQSGSCVRDARLDPGIGRCGFPGAPCTIDAKGNDNCAYGGDNTIPHYKSICINGKCGGGLGAVCRNGDYDCNWGYYCNASYPAVGTCGGQGSFVSSQGDTGDFALDYCLSGKATLASNGFWYCLEGIFEGRLPWDTVTQSSSTNSPGTTSSTSPIDSSTGSVTTVLSSSFTIITTSTPSLSTSASSSPDTLSPGRVSSVKRNMPIIAGVCTAIGLVVVAALLFMAWRFYHKRNQTKSNSVAVTTNGQTTTPLHHSTGTSEKALSMFVPSIQSLPRTTYAYTPEIQPESQAYGAQGYDNAPISGQNTGASYPATATNVNSHGTGTIGSYSHRDPFMSPVRRTNAGMM